MGKKKIIEISIFLMILFCIIFGIVFINGLKESDTKKESSDLLTENEYTGIEKNNDSEESYMQDKIVGTTVIRNGTFCEKTHSKSSLLLEKEHIDLSEIYYTNLANENTHIQIREGILYAESYNESGQLGLGDKEYHYNAKGFFIPYEIDTNVISAGIGKTFITYLKKDGNLYMVGVLAGQDEMPAPTLILTDVIYVDCGQEFILALRKDGSVWILGQQLAENEEERKTVKYPEFTKVFDGANYISAGRYTAAVILRDQSLWIWGDNTYGQCGVEADGKYYYAEEAVRISGKYKMIWMDLPEFNSRYSYIADPDADGNEYVLNNYRTYMQKTDGSLLVCGDKVTENIIMPLELY